MEKKRIPCDYPEYMKNSKKLFKLIFGKKLYKKLKNTPLKSIEWDGAEIYTSSILVVFPGIKERLTESGIEYFKNNNVNALEMFLQIVFHYGFDNAMGMEHEKKRDEEAFLKKRMKKYNDEKNKTR